jgi:putative Holliday junction resolvase
VSWRPGVWLGVDFGAVRIGVARSDPDGRLATAVGTVTRDRSGDRHIGELAKLIGEYDAVGVVVGLPRTLRGELGTAARAAQQFAAELADRVAPVFVELSDERLTTVTAGRRLLEGGVRGRRRRAIIDAAAAVEILQGWLDGHRPPGAETG